jgi:hypothetical protein
MSKIINSTIINLSDDDQFVKNIFVTGSLVEAVKIKSIEPSKLFEYFCKNSQLSDINRFLYYIEICQIIKPKDQYFNGIHVLGMFVNPVLVCVYLHFGGNINAPFTALGNTMYDSITIKDMYIEHENLDENNYRIILDNFIQSNNIKFHYECLTRSPKFYETYLITNTSTVLSELVDSDWFDMFIKVDLKNIIDHILDRLIYLRNKFPLYYYRVFRPNIISLFEIYKFPNKLPIDKYYTLNKIIPEIGKKFFASLSNYALTIASYPQNIQCYLLGYNIEYCSFSNSDFFEALTKLSEIGIDKYYENIKFNTQKFCENIASAISDRNINIGDKGDKGDKGDEGDDYIFCNTTDTKYEDIFSYSPYDIIVLHINNKNFLYTRAEFEYMISNNNNIYTRDKIPEAVKYNIENKLYYSLRNKLPASRPLIDIITDLKPYNNSEKSSRDSTPDSINDLTYDLNATSFPFLTIFDIITAYNSLSDGVVNSEMETEINNLLENEIESETESEIENEIENEIESEIENEVENDDDASKMEEVD